MSPVLVLLHGMLGGPRSFDCVRAGLRRRSYAPTLFGHGFDLRRVPERFDEAVDGLAAELEAALGPAPVDLLGYSFGARMALGLCARHPGRFRRAVLVSVHPGLRTDAERAARRAEDEAFAAVCETEGLPALVARWEARPLFATQHALSASVLDAQRVLRRAHDPQSIADVIRRLGLAEMPARTEALARLAPRIRLVVGEADEKFHRIALALASQTPGLGVDVISGVGHNPLIEAPSALAALVERFLAAPLASPVPFAAKELRP